MVVVSDWLVVIIGGRGRNSNPSNLLQIPPIFFKSLQSSSNPSNSLQIPPILFKSLQSSSNPSNSLQIPPILFKFFSSPLNLLHPPSPVDVHRGVHKLPEYQVPQHGERQQGRLPEEHDDLHGNRLYHHHLPAGHDRVGGEKED